jgi:hypothetical protein
VTLHSNAHGLSATRGGATSRDGAISRPAWSNSLAPRRSEAEVAFIASRRSQVGMFHTNSRVCSARLAESFNPSLEKAIIGGAPQTALKKL